MCCIGLVSFVLLIFFFYSFYQSYFIWKLLLFFLSHFTLSSMVCLVTSLLRWSVTLWHIRESVCVNFKGPVWKIVGKWNIAIQWIQWDETRLSVKVSVSSKYWALDLIKSGIFLSRIFFPHPIVLYFTTF